MLNDYCLTLGQDKPPTVPLGLDFMKCIYLPSTTIVHLFIYTVDSSI